MATVQASGSKFKIAGVNLYILGNASESSIGAWLIRLVSSSFSGSITVVGNDGGKAVVDDAVAFVPIVYHQNYLNGSVADGTLVSTAITGESLIIVPASGMSVGLNVTSYVSGSLIAYVTPITAG